MIATSWKVMTLRMPWVLILILAGAGCSVADASDDSRPNFVWLVSEDNSKHYLRLYNDAGAETPTIEALAGQGIVFENAFANAPVCSVARSTLATGVYGPRTATQYHRAYQLAALPAGLVPVSKMLKDSGYYATNRHKQDYNFRATDDLWDESSQSAHWQNRDDGMPFFHMQSFGITHEAALHFNEADVAANAANLNVDGIRVSPVYPDTPTFRYTHAFFLERHRQLDRQINQVITELEDAGELENTFVFYFGDHGGVLPASKGYLFESGLSVPLVIRIPKNFEHLVGEGFQQAGGTRVEGTVSFVDFAPTLLELAGLEPSTEHDGLAFLGPDIDLSDFNRRDSVFGYADRFDEKMDLVRSLRIGQYKYIRYFQPHYADALYNAYRYKQAAYREWKALNAAGELDELRGRFFRSRAPEALFDLASDPQETVNLADSPEHSELLRVMRSQLTDRLKSLPDLSFFPESVVVQEALDDPANFGRDSKQIIAGLVDIANLQLLDYPAAEGRLEALLEEGEQWEQYWALVSLSRFGTDAAGLVPVARPLLQADVTPLVRARAMEFLFAAADIDVQEEMQALINSPMHAMEKLEVLNIAAFMSEQKGYNFDVTIDDSLPELRDLRYWFESRASYLAE